MYPVRLDLGSLIQFSHKDLVTAQDGVPTIAPVKQSLTGGPRFLNPGDSNAALLNNEASKLIIQDSMLYRKVERKALR